MLYGNLKLVKKGENESIISVKGKKVSISKGSTICVLSDPFYDDIQGYASITEFTYDEFLDNFDEDNEPTDDLMFAAGIGTY